MINRQTRILVALAAVGILQILYYVPQLPEYMATHFDANGHPNGYSTRGFFSVVNIFTTAMVVGLFYFLPRRLHNLPHDRLSLPKRDYWLSPERRRSTIEYIRERAIWLGASTLAFTICINQLVIGANIEPDHRLSAVSGLFIAAYLLYAVLWVVKFVGHFLRIPKEPVTG